MSHYDYIHDNFSYNYFELKFDQKIRELEEQKRESEQQAAKKPGNCWRIFRLKMAVFQNYV